jgi:non-ribosomal peptide synthetase component E (peptide arylation enzyme)
VPGGQTVEAGAQVDPLAVPDSRTMKQQNNSDIKQGTTGSLLIRGSFFLDLRDLLRIDSMS